MENNNVITGKYKGLNYNYYPQDKVLDFTNGKLNWNGSDFGKPFLGARDTESGMLLNNVMNDTCDYKRMEHFEPIKLKHKYMYPGNIKAVHFGNVDISNVNNMSNMFAGTDAQVIDLGKYFDTSNVKDMSCMFMNDSNLKLLNLGNYFDTHNVIDMGVMFRDDSKLQSLDLGNKFDTSNVIDMSSMFDGDSNLQSLNLGNKFNTSNVTDMSWMFSGDINLQSLNLGNKFNTSHVTDMSSMFDGDSNLQSLNLGNKFNTSKVTRMVFMFMYDNNLHSLNLGNKFDTKVTSDVLTDTFDVLGHTEKLTHLKVNHKSINPTELSNDKLNKFINNLRFTKSTKVSNQLSNDLEK